MVAPTSKLPECPSCGGWGTADGKPTGESPHADAHAIRHPCRRCDGTGNAPLSLPELQRVLKKALDLASLCDELGIAVEAVNLPRPRLLFRTAGGFRRPDLLGAVPEFIRSGPDTYTREHYEQGGAEVVVERLIEVRDVARAS